MEVVQPFAVEPVHCSKLGLLILGCWADNCNTATIHTKENKNFFMTKYFNYKQLH